MPLDDLHRQVASIALGAAAEHGFALGGGNALIAHGIIDRQTEDVDLFTDQETGVTDEDFADAGQRLDQLSDRRFTEAGLRLDDVARLRERLAEWPREATHPGPEPGQRVELSRSLDPDRGLERLEEPQVPGRDPGPGRSAQPEAREPESPDADREAGQ